MAEGDLKLMLLYISNAGTTGLLHHAWFYGMLRTELRTLWLLDKHSPGHKVSVFCLCVYILFCVWDVLCGCVERSEDDLWELVLSFYPVSLGIELRSLGLAGSSFAC